MEISTMNNLANFFRRSNDAAAKGRFLQSIGRMQHQIDRLFDENWPGKRAQNFVSSCDIEDTGTHILMSFDLPGVKKEDIALSLANGLVTLTVRRKEEKERETRTSYQSERLFGTYTRSFLMPAEVDEEHIQTLYKDGVLRVAFRKVDTPKAKKIAVGDDTIGLWEQALDEPAASKNPPKL